MSNGLLLIIPTGYLVIRAIGSFQNREWMLWDFFLGIASVFIAGYFEYHIRLKSLAGIAKLHNLPSNAIELIQLTFLISGIILIVNSSWHFRLYKDDWR